MAFDFDFAHFARFHLAKLHAVIFAICVCRPTESLASLKRQLCDLFQFFVARASHSSIVFFLNRDFFLDELGEILGEVVPSLADNGVRLRNIVQLQEDAARTSE